MSEEDARNFLLEGKVGRLGLSDNTEPYVIPVLYVYDLKTDAIYIHCAKKGRKIDAISSNQRVCFEIDEMSGIVATNKTCEFDLIYRSAICFGEAIFVHEPLKKADVLNKIIEKYTKTFNTPVTADLAKNTQIIMIKILSKSGKENKGKILPYS